MLEKNLRKHVAIIHAYSIMSSLQRKIVNVLLYEAHKLNNQEESSSKDTSKEFRLSLSNLAKSVCFNSNNIQYLKEAIDGLASLKIDWNLLKDKAPIDISFLNLRILQGSPTFYHDGTFNYSFHKVLLELVSNPAIYGTIDLNLQSQFESKYSHSLYENCTRFVNLQKNKIIQIDTFRKLLGVNEGSYDSMRELTRSVITPSLEEVNDRADFLVILEKVKVGKKISAFDLKISGKKKQNIARNHHIEIIRELIEKNFGKINEKSLHFIVQSYPEKYIHEKIQYTKKHAKKESSGLYPIRYLMSALKDDYVEKEKGCEEMRSRKISAHDKNWVDEFNSLQSEVNHWKKQLEISSRMNNAKLLENIQKIYNDCLLKLQRHISQQSYEGKEAV